MLIDHGPFTGLQANGYSVVLADPPWRYKVWSSKGMGRSPKYPTMTLDEIKALPVKQLCKKNTVLLMWIIDTHLPQGLEVMAAWGFQFKTVGLYWAKNNLVSPGRFTGMGYWTRANPEQCFLGLDEDAEEGRHQALFGTLGKPSRVGRDVPRLIDAPRREHSRKPDESFDRIERLVAGPYVELFSRQERAGWDTWGFERGKFRASSLTLDNSDYGDVV